MDYDVRYMEVSINAGPPKRDGVFHGKSILNVDDLGVPPFVEPPYIYNSRGL